MTGSSKPVTSTTTATPASALVSVWAPAPVESLAVFPVVGSLTFVFRSVCLAYQEVTIALLGPRQEQLVPLRTFAVSLGLVTTACLAVFGLTPFSGVWFETISGLTPDLAAFAILQALSESANSLNWALMGEFFGRRSFATLRGWQHLPDQLVSMWTAVWMGMIYDATGSYYLALFPLSGILFLSALTFLALPRPRLPDRLRTRTPVESASPAD